LNSPEKNNASHNAHEVNVWKKQFITNEPRLSEAVKMYKEAGFEVRLEPLPKNQESKICHACEEESESECFRCFEGSENQYKIIYTRPLKNKTNQVEK
jgi:hypothetical protein